MTSATSTSAGAAEQPLFFSRAANRLIPAIKVARIKPYASLTLYLFSLIMIVMFLLRQLILVIAR